MQLLDGYANKQGLETLLWRSERLSVVAVDDAAYPGFCRVIWNEHVKEMTRPDAGRAHCVMDESCGKSSWRVREVMQPEKVNVASLGNMTPHLHWHVIPRYRDDAHFPNPVWAVVRARRRPECWPRAARCCRPCATPSFNVYPHKVSS